MTWKARVKSQTLGFSKLRVRTQRCGQAWPLACSPCPSLCSCLCPHLAGLTGTCVDTRSLCPQAITPFCPPQRRAALETDRRKMPKKQTWSPEQDSWGSQDWEQVLDTESKWACSTGPTDSSLNGRACSEEGQGGTLVCAWF